MDEFHTVANYPAGYGKMLDPLVWYISNHDLGDSIRLLDIGSSEGTDLSNLVEDLEEETGKNVKSIGLEPQKAAYRDKAQENSDNVVRGIAGNKEYEIHVKSGSVDIITSNYLLPFLDTEEQSRALREIKNVLRPGGIIALHVEPDPYSEDRNNSYWVLGYEDFEKLHDRTSGFEDYPLKLDDGDNLLYSDNRGKLTEGFYDGFREKLDEVDLV